MKKSTIRIYSIIAFVVLPIIIIVLGIGACFYMKDAVTAPTYNPDEVTSQTQTGELWSVLTIQEGEDAYIIYKIGFDDGLDERDVELVAFQGTSVEEIEDVIGECYQGTYPISYWEGEEKYFDFTTTNEFEEYLEDIKNKADDNDTPDLDVINFNFSNVALYDIGAYKGYHEENMNIGTGIALSFFVMAIAVLTIVALLIELVIAIILKLTIFKVKKEKEVHFLFL